MPGDEEGRILMGLFCRTRVPGHELLDQPETSAEDIGGNLRDMAAINRWLGGADAVIAHAVPMLKACSSDPVRVLDVACGGGDLSRFIVDEARVLGKQVEVTALDISDKVLGWAGEMSSRYPEISFVRADALSLPFKSADFDLVILASFIHHLRPEQVITALQSARRVCRGHVIAADLVRSTMAYLDYCILSRLARFSPMTIHDGAVSIRAAYSPDELAELARHSGLEKWQLHRHRQYRMTLVYEGQESAV